MYSKQINNILKLQPSNTVYKVVLPRKIKKDISIAHVDIINKQTFCCLIGMFFSSCIFIVI